MRVCPTALSLLACALMGACSESSTSADASLLASTRIGPEGGLVVVQGGKQDGLVLEIPPGVLTEAIEFRVLDTGGTTVPAGTATVSPPIGGYPFRIEPATLVVDAACRLRIPYLPSANSMGGPGNVIVNQINPWAIRDYDPENLSVVDRWVEVGVKTLGQFQVRLGEQPASLLDYTPPLGEVAMLEGGFQFLVDEEPASSPFALPEAQQWRLTGPWMDEAVIFNNGQIYGRRSEAQNWLEIWSSPYNPYQSPGSGFAIPQPTIMTVQNPIGVLGVGASLMYLGTYVYSEPIEYNGLLQLDVLKLSLNVAYNRADLGSGERNVTYWLSPTEGLLRVMIDGVIYNRIP